jgi:A/G-specific adenine glycosylase
VYPVLVSEIMLQQTQVDRVIPFYKRFMKQFPSAKALAAAPLGEVLVAWQGLGYNRRAKMLHQAAKVLAVRRVKTVTDLETLPGVGPYTARAVAAFAFNIDTPVIETNIRTVIIHHFFNDAKQVTDAEIENVLVEVLPLGRSREWYSALMDHGAYLKRQGISHNARSQSYSKQAKFAGSLREARGAILRKLAVSGFTPPETLTALLGEKRRAQMRTALRALFSENLIEKRGSAYGLTTK